MNGRGVEDRPVVAVVVAVDEADEGAGVDLPADVVEESDLHKPVDGRCLDPGADGFGGDAGGRGLGNGSLSHEMTLSLVGHCVASCPPSEGGIYTIADASDVTL